METARITAVIVALLHTHTHTERLRHFSEKKTIDELTLYFFLGPRLYGDHKAVSFLSGDYRGLFILERNF